LEHHASRQGRGIDQFQIDPLAIREQSFAAAQNQRVDVQVVSVDQIVFRQSMAQHAAAIDEDVLAGLLFKLAHLVDYAAADDGRISPDLGGLQSGGHHELAHRIHGVPKRIVDHGLERVAVGDPGFAPQQKRIRLRKGFRKMGADLVMPVWQRPTAVDKAAIGIFVGAAGRLDHAVQCDEFVNDYFSHGFLSQKNILSRLFLKLALVLAVAPLYSYFSID
jgi:hypothetical protein